MPKRVNGQLWTIEERDLPNLSIEQLQAMLVPHDPNRKGVPDPLVHVPMLEEKIEEKKNMVRQELARRGIDSQEI